VATALYKYGLEAVEILNNKHRRVYARSCDFAGRVIGGDHQVMMKSFNFDAVLTVLKMITLCRSCIGGSLGSKRSGEVASLRR